MPDERIFGVTFEDKLAKFGETPNIPHTFAENLMFGVIFGVLSGAVLSDNDREQYNRMARALKNNGQVALRAAPSGEQGRSPCYVHACKIENARK